MGRLRVMQGLNATTLIALVLVVGCASGPRHADESAVDLGRKVVTDSVPLAGLAVQALVGSSPPLDKGTYRIDTQRFCPANASSLARARQDFTELCSVKGAIYDGRFCRKGGSKDEVLFMARLDGAGTSGCHILATAEPKPGADTAEYIRYLTGQGYVTNASRQAELSTERDSARVRAEAQQQMDATRRRAEEARVASELTAMKKRGTRVCKLEGERVLSGFVEDFTDEKLKVLVNGGYLTRNPSVQIQVPAGTITWDAFVMWRLC